MDTFSYVIRVTERFFSGVLHPHLLGVRCPNPFFMPRRVLTSDGVTLQFPELSSRMQELLVAQSVETEAIRRAGLNCQLISVGHWGLANQLPRDRG